MPPYTGHGGCAPTALAQQHHKLPVHMLQILVALLPSPYRARGVRDLAYRPHGHAEEVGVGVAARVHDAEQWLEQLQGHKEAVVEQALVAGS